MLSHLGKLAFPFRQVRHPDKRIEPASDTSRSSPNLREIGVARSLVVSASNPQLVEYSPGGVIKLFV